MGKAKRRWIIFISLLILVVAGGYLVLRYRVLAARNFKPDPKKAATPLDLRPALIAKLQQIVKDGSNGLYLLNIDTLYPDLTRSLLEARQVRLQVDSTGYRRLAQERQLPDDVFNIQFTSLRIEGINIDDLLHRRQVDLSGIRIINPVISSYRKLQPYNAGKRAASRSRTLYQRLMQQMDRIRIGQVDLRQGTFISYSDSRPGRSATFKNISIRLDDILIDSTTQYDNSRFLFARNAMLETKDYSLPSPDSQYIFRIGTLTIAGHQHQAVARQVELLPRGGREAFLRRLKKQDELFTVTSPKVTLSGIEWWAMVNGAGLVADKAEVEDLLVDVFMDKSLPPGSPTPPKSFPHQRLMKIPFPVSVRELVLHGAGVTYGEFNPKSGRSGKVSFTGIAATADNITNVPAEIRAHPVATFRARATFMQGTPMDCTFRLDLARHATGAFSVDIKMGALGKDVVNRFAPALSLTEYPSGQMEEGVVHLRGDNHRVRGTISLRYSDLHINPLKEKSDGDLKKKRFTGLLANIVMIKNNNPGKDGSLRQPEIDYRPPGTVNFFALIWTGIRVGLLETIGIPLKIGMKGS